MRLLITGGAGFIGSYVAERATAAGHEVRILDNLDPQVHPDPSQVSLPPKAEFVRGDVRDRETCQRALDDIDTVVHCASAVGVAQSMYRVEHYVDTNVRGTACLLEEVVARRDAIAKVVALTSMTQYGEGLYARPSDGRTLRVGIRTEADIREAGWEPACPDTGEPLVAYPTPESAELQGRSVYAQSKRAQEDLVLTLGASYNLPVVCLRLFNVYGPRQSLQNPYTGVLAIFLSRLLAGQRPLIYEDGGQTRDFVSVHDVVRVIFSVIGSTVSDGLVLNVGSGTPRTVSGIAATLARLIERKDLAPDITRRFRQGDVRHCLADIALARRLLGFEPATAWEDGLSEMVAWARSAPSDDRTADADQELREHQLVTETPIATEEHR